MSATEKTLSLTGTQIDNVLSNAILKTSQSLTSAEKAQVRTNIGVADLVPNVTTTDNGKFLRVVNGKWTAVDLAVYNGETIG